jgi:hypothetical protein
MEARLARFGYMQVTTPIPARKLNLDDGITLYRNLDFG